MVTGAFGIVDNAYMVSVTQGAATSTTNPNDNLWSPGDVAPNSPEPEGYSDPGAGDPAEPTTMNRAAGLMTSIFLPCPVCNLRVDNMSQLVGHIRAM